MWILEAELQIYGRYNSGMGAFTTLITISVLLAGAFFLTRGEMPVEDLVTALLYINNLTDPVKELISFTEQFQNGYSDIPVSWSHGGSPGYQRPGRRKRTYRCKGRNRF